MLTSALSTQTISFSEHNPIKMAIRVFFILLFISTSLPSQIVPVGLGSYTTALPTGATILPNNPAPGTSHYQKPDNVDRTGAMPKVVPGFSQPITTHEWWSSAMWSYEMHNSTYYPDWVISPYSFVMHPHPVIVAATRYGMNITSEDNPVSAGNDYHNYRENHLSVGLDGMDVPANTGTKVKSYGDWSVTLQWNDGAGRVLEATSGHGFPYVYFKKSGASDPTLRFQAGVPAPYSTISNATVVARGVTILGKSYGIFCPPGTTFGATYTLNQMEGDMVYNNVPRDAYKVQLPAGQNYFSIALLPDNSPATLAYYAKFAFSFVTDTKVAWEYDECKSEVKNTFTFTTEPQGNSTETKTLMAMYRHQWMHTTATPTAYTYPVTARGAMKVFEGTSFSNIHTNHGFLPSLPDFGTYNKATIAAYVKQEVAKGKNFFFYADNASLAVYGAGVALQKVVDLAELADMVGDNVSRDIFLTWTKNYLQRWFTTGKAAAPNDDQFYYDATWQSLIGLPSAFESDRQLNDHHFGYGYFVKAAATVVKYEPNNTWQTQWGPMVEMLIKDVANWDRSNTQFPFLRNFDPYAGHSWASGHANFTKGNNQESSSEAINFASGVALWGTETDNKTLRDLGAFLYTTEIEAVRQYWFDEDNAVFPAAWTRNFGTMIWGWGAEYQTWFSGDPEHIHGINYLPINGSSLYLGLNPTAANNNYNELVGNAGGINSDFKDIIWCYQALFNASAAKATFAANEASYIPQTGETKAHTYQWIYALDKLGTVDATITADMPTYAVFNKDGCKHYVVYNPAGMFAKEKVTFSDGRCFLLPKEDSIYVFNKCPDVVIPDSIYVTCPNNPVKLTAKDTTCATNYQWDRNGTNIGGAISTSYMAATEGEYHVSYNISNCIVKKDTFIVQLKDTINVTNIKATCNGTNTAYTLTFDISEGEAPYSVTGGPGSLTGSTFTSGLITSGSAYSFVVTDKNECDYDTISGSKSCACAVDIDLGPDTVVCSASSITLDAGVTGTYTWSTSETSKTISVSNAGTYIVSVSDTNGCTGSDTVNVKNAQAPATPAFSETCNGTTDYTVTFTLSGGDSLSYEVLVNGIGPGGPGTLSGNIFTSSPIPSGSAYSFIVKDKNNCTPNIVAGSKNCNCGTSAGNMSLTGMTVCENSNAVATATSGSTLDGDDVLLYYLHNNNGTLLGTVFDTNTSPSFTFAAPMVYGTTYYISAVAGNSDGNGGIDLNDPCLSVAKGTPVVFNALPTPSAAGNDTTICGNSISLSGNITLVGTGIWTVSSGSGTFSNITSPNPIVSTLGTGNNTFVWTIVNGSCPTSSSSVTAQSLVAPGIADAGGDQTLCNLSVANLAGNTPLLSETGTWTLADGSATIVNANDPASSISGLSSGKITLVWTISNGFCATTDTVEIVVETRPSAANAGNDQNICSTATTLSATVPVIGSGAWTLISGSANIVDANSPTSQLTGLSNASSTVLLWTTANGTCPADTQSVVIKVRALPQINLGEDSTLCAGDNVLLNASDTSTSSTYIWQDNSTKAQFLANEPGQYFVRISSGDCKEISDTIVFDNNCPYSFFVPNAFTPNGDNKNDVFTAKAYNIMDFKMDIFNRWGENIFTSTDISTGWNGKGKFGHDSQIDVYVYKITFSVLGKNEKTIEKLVIGRITLIR